jgi:arginyl-tRNA--protein-N-Asp/Glu arginylyltransferase
VTAITRLRFYSTQPHPCSYLLDQTATTLFLDPTTDIDASIYSRLSVMGFRRSGPHIYRPHCAECQACVPCRIPVDTFKPTRKQRRTLKQNTDITVIALENLDDPAIYDMYERYINERHQDGDMYPPTREQFDSFLTEAWGRTHFFGMFAAEKLLGVAVVDELDNAFSAVYTFYDPDETSRSLGHFAILWQIEEAKRRNLSYVYLGYWIKNCRKMNYKSQYRPIELLINDHWLVLN